MIFQKFKNEHLPRLFIHFWYNSRNSELFSILEIEQPKGLYTVIRPHPWILCCLNFLIFRFYDVFKYLPYDSADFRFWKFNHFNFVFLDLPTFLQNKKNRSSRGVCRSRVWGCQGRLQVTFLFFKKNSVETSEFFENLVQSLEIFQNLVECSNLSKSCE